MAYEKLKLVDHVSKWSAAHVSHIEDGILANEQALNTKLSEKDLADYAKTKDLSNYQPKGDYALKSEIPNVDNFTTHEQVQELIEAIEFPEAGDMIALTEEEILNICKF